MSSPSAGATLAAYLAGDPQALLGLYPLMLLSIRISVVLAMTPVLYAMAVPGRIRTLLVVVLSVAIALGLPVSAVHTPLTGGELILAALTELALGATLALGVLLAFAAFSIAGHLLDVQIGFGIAQVFDPSSSRPAPLLVSAFNHVAVLVFFLVDGHHALLRGIAFSLQSFPVGAPWSLAPTAPAVVKQASALFGLGFMLAAPVVFCVLLTELALGVIARNLPQINMFALGIPTKIVVGLAALSLWFAGIGGPMNHVYSSIYSMWESIFITAPSSGPQGTGSHRAIPTTEAGR